MMLQTFLKQEHQRVSIKSLPLKRERMVADMARVELLSDLAEKVRNAIDGRLGGSHHDFIERRRVLQEHRLIVELRDLTITPFFDVGARRSKGDQVLLKGFT